MRHRQEPVGHAEEHPSELQYVKVAVVLAVVTLMEVAIFYISQLRTVLPYALLLLSLIKFVLVVLWFMHLKFDSRMFRRLFVVGVILAFGVYAIVLATFGIFFVSR